jgi:ferrochelatase
VLVMAHGTPEHPGSIAEFYTSIRRGRPPTDDQLADLRRRYEAIGGTSPLAARTAAQVDGVRALLEAHRPGRYLVALGTKHTEPSIEAGARRLADGGVAAVVGIVLTPHPSAAGSGEYLERAGAALSAHPARPAFVPVRGWYENPRFVALQAALVTQTLRAAVGDEPAEVVFTAHSLPERAVASGDPYAEHVAGSARLIAGAAGLGAWSVAWQSAGRTPERWLGPDLLEVIRRLPDRGVRAVVVCPVGFVADHLEVLYDLDVEAAATAAATGVRFARTPSLNDDPRFLGALADVIGEADPGGARSTELTAWSR